MTERALTLEEAAQRLGISIRTLTDLGRDGKIKIAHITPRIVRVPESEIARVLGVGGRVEPRSVFRQRKIKLVQLVNQ